MATSREGLLSLGVNMRSDPKSGANALEGEPNRSEERNGSALRAGEPGDEQTAAAWDDELEPESDERAPDTARPDYDTDKFALHVESAKERMTSPPEASFEMLRDSCKGLAAPEVPLGEEQILRPSSRKHKLPPTTE
jgi:hypothetical protein